MAEAFDHNLPQVFIYGDKLKEWREKEQLHILRLLGKGLSVLNGAEQRLAMSLADYRGQRSAKYDKLWLNLGLAHPNGEAIQLMAALQAKRLRSELEDYGYDHTAWVDYHTSPNQEEASAV